MLGVPVQSSWKACTFASSPFETTLKKLEDIFHLETAISLQSPNKLASNVSKSNVGDNCQAAVSNRLQ